jgi:hypothetical protein
MIIQPWIVFFSDARCNCVACNWPPGSSVSNYTIILTTADSKGATATSLILLPLGLQFHYCNPNTITTTTTKINILLLHSLHSATHRCNYAAKNPCWNFACLPADISHSHNDVSKHLILDFKLHPCSERCSLSFGRISGG